MKKVLLVDDEPNLLAALRRSLRKQFPIEIACGGAAGLAALEHSQDYSVVVSDMRMSEMNGVEFLSRVKEMAPDIVRLMLTGNADQATAIAAINRGSIFRFLNKPCPPEQLADALTAACRQHELITAEREVLENTLRGSVKVLTEILSFVDPKSFGLAEIVRDNMRRLAEALKIRTTWELEVAAMLSNIGFVTVPPEIMLKVRIGHPLTDKEQEMLRRIPAVGGSLLAQIPRLEEVSRILVYQGKCFDGSGLPDDGVSGTAIPLGARMLKVLSDLARIESQGKTRAEAFGELRSRKGWYDPQILEVLNSPLPSAIPGHAPSATASKPILLSEVRCGHRLCADVRTVDGVLIVCSGNQITPALIERFRNFSVTGVIKEPIYIEA